MAENARTSPPPIHIQMQFYAQLNTTSFAFSFHFFGTFPSYISQQFNAAISILRCYLLYFIQMQLIGSLNQGIAFIVPLLTNLLQLKYQGFDDRNKSPFATHPRTMLLAVCSSVVHHLAYVEQLRFPLRRFAVVAHHFSVGSGHALVASLASLLFPDSFSPFVYALFILPSASELLYWLYHKLVVEEGAAFQVYRRRRVHRFLDNIGVADNSFRPPLQILPV